MKLIKPTVKLMQEYLEILEEWKQSGEKIVPWVLNEDTTDFQAMISRFEGAVVEEARWLTDYWGKKTFSGLLLMPATRHNLVHLNESMRILGKEKSRSRGKGAS